MRTFLRQALLEIALRAGRLSHRNKTTIVYYHKFLPGDEPLLEAQCEYIRRYHRVISLRELTARLRNGDALPDRSIAITIDDGHRGFAEHAWPVFRRFGFPVTVYLPTAFIDRQGTDRWLWFDRATYAFRGTPHSTLLLPDAVFQGTGPASVNPEFVAAWRSGTARHRPVALDSAEVRGRTAAQVVEAAKWLLPDERSAFLADVFDRLGTPIPEEPVGEFAPLTWEEIRRLAAEGVEFGGHTATHPILASVGSDDQLRVEIEHCKQRIEAELQDAVLHFAYPSGKPEEIHPRAKEMIRQAGYHSAVTTVSGQVAPGDDPLWLDRNGVDPGVPQLWFGRCLANVRIS